MGIEKIADGIEQAKLGYMEAVCRAAERAKAEIKAANGDRSRSGSWAREVIPRWQAPPCGIASVPADSNRAYEPRRRGPLAGTVCENNENQ